SPAGARPGRRRVGLGGSGRLERLRPRRTRQVLVSTVNANQPRARRPRLSRSRSPARQDQTRPHPEQGQGQGQTPFVPDSIAVGARHLEIGSEWVASFAIPGSPGEVAAGWLQPLLTSPGRLDVSLHIAPVDPVTAANRLKRQLAKLESGRRHAADHGRLLDPQVEAATEDAYDLAARVARGEGKLFRLGLYLTVHATTADQLADEVAAVRALAASLLLHAKPT